MQGKVEQVEQHSHTVSEDGCQTGAEHAHAQLHGKDIVQHDIADIAGGAGDHHQTGVAVRPDDDAQGAGEDIGKGEQVDGAHIVHRFGEDAVGGAEYPGQRHNEHRGEQGQGQAHNCQQYHRLGKDPVGLLGLSLSGEDGGSGGSTDAHHQAESGKEGEYRQGHIQGSQAVAAHSRPHKEYICHTVEGMGDLSDEGGEQIAEVITLHLPAHGRIDGHRSSHGAKDLSIF